MRAAVLRHGQLVVDDVPEPAPGAGQVLVRTLACALFGPHIQIVRHLKELAESHRSAGASFMFDPARDVVMGHEFCGQVMELGPGVSEVSPGDVVVSMPTVVTDAGREFVGYSHQYPGGYGERMVLTAALCRRVADGVDPRHAALAEPMAIGAHAVARSGIERGESAIVLGCGAVGLGVIASLRLAGVQPIVAADLSSKRRELALHMGAQEAVDPREQPAVEAWRRLEGTRPLVIFEAVGMPGMLAQAMREAPGSARILVVGSSMGPESIWPMLGVNKELTILFSRGAQPEEFDRALDLIAGGTIDVAPLITSEVGVSDIPRALEELADPEAHGIIMVVPAPR